MAKLVLTNPVITINSVDLSDHIASVALDTKYDEIERVSTLRVGTVTLPEVAERFARMRRDTDLPYNPMVL